jgi:L-asparaginase
MDVAKVHPYRVDAFSSGDAGPLGWVENGHLRRLRAWPVAAEDRAEVLAAAVARHAPEDWPWVAIVLNHVGADGLVVDALVSAGVRGLVAAGTGNGTLSVALETSLLRARAAGVEVLRSTRCATGAVLPQQADAISAAPGLSPVKARVALLLDLLAG